MLLSFKASTLPNKATVDSCDPTFTAYVTHLRQLAANSNPNNIDNNSDNAIINNNNNNSPPTTTEVVCITPEYPPVASGMINNIYLFIIIKWKIIKWLF